MAITVPELLEALAEELKPDQCAAITARAHKRIPAARLESAVTWLENTPVLDPKGKRLHWSMYCVSGFCMPDYPGIPDLSPDASFVLWRLFQWICVTDLSGVDGPFTKSEFKEAIGL